MPLADCRFRLGENREVIELLVPIEKSSPDNLAIIYMLGTALVRVSPESYDKVIDTYKNPFVNLMEIGLVGAVLFHALNGLRIIAIDFWSKGTRLQRQMLWLIVLVWIVVMVPGAFFMFKHSFEVMFGSAS